MITKNLLFIDTETIGSITCMDGCVPFEIGAKVLDSSTGKVLFQRSYIVRRFINNKYIMLGSFSAGKYPSYLERIKNDKRFKVLSALEISKDLKRVIKKYNIGVWVAHNGCFDKGAISRYFNDMSIFNPLEKLDYLDTMEISKVITLSQEYQDYCIYNKGYGKIINKEFESDFITNSGRVKTTAQAIYSYIVKNPEFQEQHTALEDIDIEIEIFKESMKLKPIIILNKKPHFSEFPKIV